MTTNTQIPHEASTSIDTDKLAEEMRSWVSGISGHHGIHINSSVIAKWADRIEALEGGSDA